MYRYEIDENFAVTGYVEGQEFPMLFQPDYPNGDKFDSREEAERWAQLWVDAFSSTNPYPPEGKNIPGKPKLLPSEPEESTND